jgi:hypothetical protein
MIRRSKRLVVVFKKGKWRKARREGRLPAMDIKLTAERQKRVEERAQFWRDLKKTLDGED